MKIGVMIGGLAYDSQKQILEGILKGAAENDAQVFVFTCDGHVYMKNEHSMGEFNIFNLPDMQKLDGIIVVPDTIQDEQTVKELIEKIKRLQLSAVCIEGNHKELCSL